MELWLVIAGIVLIGLVWPAAFILLARRRRLRERGSLGTVGDGDPVGWQNNIRTGGDMPGDGGAGGGIGGGGD